MVFALDVINNLSGDAFKTELGVISEPSFRAFEG